VVLGVVGAESAAAAASGAALLLALLMLSSAAAGEVRLASMLAGSILLQERPIRLDELCSQQQQLQQHSEQSTTYKHIASPAVRKMKTFCLGNALTHVSSSNAHMLRGLLH
jgi:hypothetical protein